MPLLAQAQTPIPSPPPGTKRLWSGVPDQILPVQFRRQEADNWCWAACGQMLIDFYKARAVSQCLMASTHFGLACCPRPLDKDCDHGAWPEDVYPAYGLGLDRLGWPLDEHDLADELQRRAPVEVYYRWSGPGAHVALVVGRYANGDFLVHDPWFGSGPRSHRNILEGYGLGAWTMTYRTEG